MKSKLAPRLVVTFMTIFSLTATLIFSVNAQSEQDCYAVADNDQLTNSPDALVILNRLTGETTIIGFTGTANVEAIAFPLGADTLYAANAGQLGTLNLTTGLFTPAPNPFGAGQGAVGTVVFDDVDGLTFDPVTGILYGAHRRSGVGAKDALFQINPSTGSYIEDAFGAGIDYILIDSPGVLDDIDDIAVDPLTQQMYAASNDGGVGGILITVDKVTGAAAIVGPFGIDDVEGLAFFNDGQLYGSTGLFTSGPPTNDRLYQVDKTTGAATEVAPFSQYQDYEGLDCLTGEDILTATPSITPTATASSTPSPTATATETPTASPSPTSTQQPTNVTVSDLAGGDEGHGALITLVGLLLGGAGLGLAQLYRRRSQRV